MESNGRTWEGYEWVDGWPVSPPRHQPLQQQQQQCEPAFEGGMVVEPAEPAEPAAAAIDNSTATNSAGDSASGRHSTNTNQVNDFLSSYTGSNCGSEEDSEDNIPDEKQVDLGNVYSQCRAAREAAFDPSVHHLR
jgi:hypothetical protein